MKIAICDDLNCDRDQLLSHINNYCETNFINAIINKYDSGEALLEEFTKNSVDIILLDIYMKGLSGIDTAKRIREIDSNCIIVFVTRSSEHALEGFAVNALHYLVKPITTEKTTEIFKRCQKVLKTAQQFIEVMSNRLLVKIPIRAINFIEVYDKACFIQKDSEVIKTYLPLEEIATRLDMKKFLHCHRSYIVNMHYIANVEDNNFVLQSGKNIPIRQSEKKIIKQTYMNYLFALTKD